MWLTPCLACFPRSLERHAPKPRLLPSTGLPFASSIPCTCTLGLLVFTSPTLCYSYLNPFVPPIPYLAVWCGAIYYTCIYLYPDIIPLRGMPLRSPTTGPSHRPLDYLRGSASVYFISSVISPPFRSLPGNRHYVSLGPTCRICIAL